MSPQNAVNIISELTNAPQLALSRNDWRTIDEAVRVLHELVSSATQEAQATNPGTEPADTPSDTSATPEPNAEPAPATEDEALVSSEAPPS